MWWAASRGVEAYVGTTLLGVRHPGAPAEWFDVPSVDAGVARLASELSHGRPANRRHLRVWFSAALARPFIVPAESGAQSDDEARAVAESIVLEETGMAERTALWIDAWRSGRDTTAVATRAGLLEQIRSACDGAKVRLSSVKPWWNLAIEAAANATKASDDVLWSLREDDGMTWGLLKAGAVSRAECVLPSSHDPDWVHTRQRTQFALGASALQWHARRAAERQTRPGVLPIGDWVLDADHEPESASGGR